MTSGFGSEARSPAAGTRVGDHLVGYTWITTGALPRLRSVFNTLEGATPAIHKALVQLEAAVREAMLPPSESAADLRVYSGAAGVGLMFYSLHTAIADRQVWPFSGGVLGAPKAFQPGCSTVPARNPAAWAGGSRGGGDFLWVLA